MKNILFVLLAGLLFFVGCGESGPSFATVPYIEYVEMSKTVAQSGANDSLWITIYFEDGEGDIGSPENGSCINTCNLEACLDTPNIDAFVIDSRNECFQTYRLPDVEQDGKVRDLSGEFELKVSGLNCRCIGCSTDSVRYRVFIRDKAGNRSNEVVTDWLQIDC